MNKALKVLRALLLGLVLSLGIGIAYSQLVGGGPEGKILTLEVDDKNIRLGNVATPTDATADGGGLILHADNDITILWRNVSNEWEYNQSINLLGNNLRTTGTVSAGRAFFNNFGFDNGAFFSLAGDLNVDGALGANSFKVQDSGKLEIIGALQISSGTPAIDRVLTSIDVDGNTEWRVLPQSVGWIGGGGIVNLSTSTDKVDIGGFAPDSKLHVTDGIAGAVTAFVGTIATFESSGAGYLSILTPDVSTSGILFGEPSSNIAGGIFYNDPGSPDGFQFRINGNQTKMVIEKDGIGMGTTNPDFTALLELKSTTHGFLPPRMTTVEIGAIASPATGLSMFDLTIDKPVVRTSSEFKTLLTEDLGQVVVQETFASTNVRFFGELALPVAQGWTDTATGIATIDLVTQTVFGEVKQVVRHNDDTTGGSTTSKITLTEQNWIDVNNFGASYSGTARLDTANGASGFFSGLQANAAENPLATGNRRYGIQFSDDAGNLKVLDVVSGGTSVTFDGTGGNPLITFDEWFRWECVVPAGLGAAQFYVNGVLSTFAPTFGVNTGGLGTQIIVSSGSTGGVDRITYHDNFGVTIFEESATKTLAVVTMVANVAQINIPEGKRDYTIILPDGNPRLIGSVLRLVANNLGGSVELQNQIPAVPEILYNGLRTLVINIAVKETIEGINTVDQANIYLGFEIATLHVGGKFIDTTDQTIVVAGTPQVITFNTNKIIDDISHTIGSSVFNINTSGTYKLEVAPQVFQGSGAAKIEFWFRKNGTDIVNSGVQSDIGANNQALPILLWKEIVIAGDTIECVWASDSGNTKLDNITSLFGGPNIPSIMFRMTLVDT